MRKLMLTTAAVLAAVGVLVLVTLPPKPIDVPLQGVDPALLARTVSGAFHIHTSRSDGAGDKPSIAADASRAGVKFAIFTDHGDGTRPPDPPAYISGVLCIDGVEISTTGGHYVAFDMPASPYPLGGEPSAVVEDVARLGGFGVAAHPDHPKPALAWTDWSVPIDGIEWLNADAEWRDETPTELLRVAVDYLARPGPALASVFDRPVTTINRWDAMARSRPLVALAAVDAHGGARVRGDEDGGAALGAGPRYRASFESISNRVWLDRPLTGDASADARLVIDAIRKGHVYSVVDAISRGVVLDLASGAFALASPPLGGSTPRTIADGGRKRLEIHVPRAPGKPPVPWVLTNWTGSYPAAPPPPVAASPEASAPIETASEWRVENDPGSSGRVSGGGAVVTLEFKLRADARASQFVGAVADLQPGQSFDRLRLRARSDRPMRVSVQLRFGEARWLTSIYLDREDRDVEIPLRVLRPADRSATAMPSVATANSVLFVVDLVNARPGDAGTFTISDLRGVR